MYNVNVRMFNKDMSLNSLFLKLVLGISCDFQIDYQYILTD